MKPEPPREQPESESSVLEKNLGQLLARSYQPESPSDEFVESAVSRLMQRAAGEAARRSHARPKGAAFWAKRAALLAACVTLAFGLGAGSLVWSGYALNPGAQVRSGLVEAVDQEYAIATLSQSVNAFWSAPLAENAGLGKGLLQLNEGLAQVVFARGAVVSLEGPVELELINDNRCRLVRGSIAAEVPPDATGFTVTTADMNVVDLGTAFGVRVGSDALTEVHVFDGEVNIVKDDTQDARPGRLLGGQAIRSAANGGWVGIQANPRSFIRKSDLDLKREELQDIARRRWLDYSDCWDNDPSTILRYDFQSADDGVILNTVDPSHHSAWSENLSPRFVEGRWPGKKAMLFDGRTDRLVVEDHPDLRLTGDFTLALWLRPGNPTYGAWTRIVGKGVGTQRNFGLWGHGEGFFLWQICPTGEFTWRDTEVETRRIAPGKWRLVVSVLADDIAKIYIDGKLNTARMMDRPIATSDAPMTIGNYGDLPAHEGFFAGEIGELVLLNRAMSATEVSEMYAAGRP